jgi:hypothetical protein
VSWYDALHSIVIRIMKTSDWLSIIALVISSGGLAIQLRNWVMSKPRLHLSVIAEAMCFPDDGRGDRAALSVINRGGGTTILTHMIVYVDGHGFQSSLSTPCQGQLRKRVAPIPTPDLPDQRQPDVTHPRCGRRGASRPPGRLPA